jgi:hypothetical protein
LAGVDGDLADRWRHGGFPGLGLYPYMRAGPDGYCFQKQEKRHTSGACGRC